MFITNQLKRKIDKKYNRYMKGGIVPNTQPTSEVGEPSVNERLLQLAKKSKKESKCKCGGDCKCNGNG